jgi:hypothetical protein
MGEAAGRGGEMVVKQDLAVVAEVRRFVRLVTGQWGVDDFVPCLVRASWSPTRCGMRRRPMTM